jgi:hypothetical protein
LFTGTGRSLELAVRRALEALGFDVSEGAPGRDDLVAQYGGRVAVLEVKGTSKSAGEYQAAQLEKWVSDYYFTQQVRPKGILVVNAFRELPLRERTEAAFPNQMLEYSERREHCLLTGLQLLGAVLAVEQDSSRRDQMIESLFATNGVYPGFQDWSAFLVGPHPSE